MRKYSHIIDEESLVLKELEFLIEFFKVPMEELGVELEDPVLESCFCCDQIFEATDINVVTVPLCLHRAHLECLRKVSKTYCTFCGNGIRSSLFSFLRSKKLSKLALDQVTAQEEEPDSYARGDPSISVIPHEPMSLGKTNGEYTAICD